MLAEFAAGLCPRRPWMARGQSGWCGRIAGSARAICSTNDLVYSTSTDGVNWTAVTRVPIDATSSTVDHFIPGIGIDPATSGAGAHVALHYYYYPQSNCTLCDLPAASWATFLRRTVARRGIAGRAHRADAAGLAAEFAERVDGGRLRRDGVHATACRTACSPWLRQFQEPLTARQSTRGRD